jgi:hypothetical protein
MLPHDRGSLKGNGADPTIMRVGRPGDVERSQAEGRILCPSSPRGMWWKGQRFGAKLRESKEECCMVDDEVTGEAEEVSDDELEEADEESFPASDPPATWSGPEEN